MNLLPLCDYLFITCNLSINLLLNDRKSTMLLDLFSSYDLKQLVTSPTRVTASSQTLIDILATSHVGMVSYINVTDIHGISDQLAVSNYITAAIRRERTMQQDSKRIWNTLRTLDVLRAKSNISLPPTLACSDNLNQHFTNIPHPHRSALHNTLLRQYDTLGIDKSFQFKTVNFITVRRYLNKIKTHASGND
nr:unnamed protein product [Callosobruchus analis]